MVRSLADLARPTPNLERAAGGKHFGWCSPAEDFARAAVAAVGDGIELGLVEETQIAGLGQILAQQLIGVRPITRSPSQCPPSLGFST